MSQAQKNKTIHDIIPNDYDGDVPDQCEANCSEEPEAYVVYSNPADLAVYCREHARKKYVQRANTEDIDYV